MQHVKTLLYVQSLQTQVVMFTTSWVKGNVTYLRFSTVQE